MDNLVKYKEDSIKLDILRHLDVDRVTAYTPAQKSPESQIKHKTGRVNE